jgi:KaiC/GvpD/RAD55 family RecA-like ATPase
MPTRKKAFSKKSQKRPSKNHDSAKKARHQEKPREYLTTGIEGFDNLFEHGVPKGAAVLISGGAGSGKTLLCLQILYNAVKKGKKCLYMTFEESEERLREHMSDFGWDIRKLKTGGEMAIKRFSIFDISRTLKP